MILRSGLRALALGVAMVCGAASAEAATLIDLSQGGTWQNVYNGLGYESAYVTALYDVTPGSDLRMGSITQGTRLISERFSGSIWYNGYRVSYGPFDTIIPAISYQGSCHLFPPSAPTSMTGGQPSCGDLGASLPPITRDLRFVVPLNAVQIQLAFFGGFNYTPPDPAIEANITEMPIPGALPLFASVLGIGGWIGYRRRWGLSI